MKFGLRYCNTGRYTDPVRAIELMQAAEAAGFESAWTVEHTVIPPHLARPKAGDVTHSDVVRRRSARN